MPEPAFSLPTVATVTGLLEHWAVKLVTSTLGALFASEPQLVALVCVLIIADMVTGVLAAIRRGEGISPKLLGATIRKTIEYAVFLSMVTAVANSFSIVSWIDQTAYLYVALTELASVLENQLSEKSRARRIWLRIRSEIAERGGSGLLSEDGVVVDVYDEAPHKAPDAPTPPNSL